MRLSGDRRLMFGRLSPGGVLVSTCALMLLAYAVLRAWLTSFTWDESYTFVHHVLPLAFFQHSFSQMGANHHLLNVWGMIAANKLFGNSELALRLPNLIAFAVYLYASARIALQARGAVLALAAFLLMNLHPYLIDFFGLARGYGMANGALMLCLWQITCYFNRGGRVASVAWATLAAVLAAMSNLVLLYFLVSFTATFVLVTGMRTILGTARFNWRHVAWPLAGLSAGLALLLPTAIGLSKGGSLFFGCDSLWDCTVASLGTRLLYDPSGGLPALVVMALAIAAAAACCTVVVVAAWRGKWAGRLVPMAFGALALAGCLVIMVVHHRWLGAPYPRARTALFLLPMATFVIASGLVAWPGRARWAAIMAALLCVPLVLLQAQSTNLVYTAEWKPAGEVSKMMSIIKREHAPFGPARPVVSVASSLESRGPLYYYLIRDTMQWLVPFAHDAPGPFTPSDFYIVESGDARDRDTAHWELLYHSAISGTELYRDKRWRNKPHVYYHEQQDMEGSDVPGRTADEHYSGRYGVRFDGISRSSKWITWVVPDTLDSPNLRLLGTAMIMQPGNLNWVTLLVRVTRNGKRIAYADVNSAMQMRKFGQWQQVALPLGPAQPLLPGDTVKVEAPPYTDDTVMYLDDLELWVLE